MTILAPATSANLGPGFDSLGLAIKLYNKVSIKAQSFVQISVRGEGAGSSWIKTNNTFVNIFNEIYATLNDDKRKFRFDFSNKIPLSRGLGSSSAVIVAAIASAYEMAGFAISKQKVLDIALTYEPHPDNIAPCVLGGFSASIIEDGKVFSKKAELDKDLRAVLLIPDTAISTKKSRSLLPAQYSVSECVNNLSHAAVLTACFFSKDYKSLRLASKDLMHEERRMSALPQLFEARKIAYLNGALLSTLSGSGSTFFSLCFADDAPKIAKAMQDAFKDYKVLVCELDNKGYRIIK